MDTLCNISNEIVAVSTLFLTVVVTTLAGLTFMSDRREVRRNKLRAAYLAFQKDSPTLDRMFAKGLKGGTAGNQRGGLPPLPSDNEDSGGLLGFERWCFSGGELKNLDVVQALVEPAGHQSRGVCKVVRKTRDKLLFPNLLKRSALLPNKKWDLVSNVRVFLNEGPKWSSKVYAVSKISGNYKNGVTLTLYEGEYEDYYNSCIGMGILAAHNPNSRSLRNLRKRMWVQEKGCSDITVKNHFALVAVGCLTVVINDNGPAMLLHRRGINVADNQEMIAEIPSGSLSSFLDNPINDTSDREVFFLDTVKREFAEELLNVDETGESPQRKIVDERLRGLIGEDNVYFLGIGFYPVQGYLMVLSLTVIDERDESVKDWMKRNDTDCVIDALTENYEGTIMTMPFGKEEIGVIRKLHRRTPGLGEITRIIESNFDEINKEINKHARQRTNRSLTSRFRTIFGIGH
ncbi:hypothetical protein CMUST_11570 [Corynebacterium mustelae]|uniref:Uncharacterized protein n=1 Tax=Corynebacterium mustelae TaxID=571915 RepID=A0A0G3H1M2_9CORY|nr:hypothetical protein [Corynebacterium mustelae]AKK06625.1 hypothetical protein CMUST_11570 [Corynebacterium mustelae]